MAIKHVKTGRTDIKRLMEPFYDLVAQEQLLAPIFNLRLSTHWVPYLKKMYTFWNVALFGVKRYAGNPLARHPALPADGAHFETWRHIENRNGRVAITLI